MIGILEVVNIFVQELVVITIFSLLIMAWLRIRTNLLDDWSLKLLISTTNKKPNVATVYRLFTKVRNDSTDELAEFLKGEMIRALSMVTDKPTTFFLRHSDEYDVLKEYIPDEEILTFIIKPLYWLDQHGHEKRNFLGKSKGVKLDDHMINEFDRLISKFESNLSISLSQAQKEITT